MRKISTCSPDKSSRLTNQYQHHKPSGFCYLIRCFDDNLFPPQLVEWSGKTPDKDISKIIVDSLEKLIRDIYHKFKTKKKVKMTCEDEIAYQRAEYCHICEEELYDDKVIDHWHLTGRYRGAAHE